MSQEAIFERIRQQRNGRLAPINRQAVKFVEKERVEGHLVGFSTIPSISGEVEGKKQLTDDEIAELIYDWWISGKSYSQWYADKFLQMKIDFGERE